MAEQERPIDLDRRAATAKKLIADKRRPPTYHEDGLWAKVLEGRIAAVEAEHYPQLGSNECTCGEASYPCSDIRILRGEKNG